MVVTLTDSPGDSLQGELELFEAGFDYPLDSQNRFRISHGPDYLRFFTAMGEASCFVAREDAGVAGVLTTVRRELRLPSATGASTVRALYLCDLKIAEGSGRIKTLFQLAASALAFHAGRENAAYAVVMKGTDRTPDTYSGGLGIPRFEPLAEVAILRIPTSLREERTEANIVPLKAVAGKFAALASGLVHSSVCPRSQGGLYQPLPLLDPDGQACGVLEDTLTSKRLVGSDGEILSAHLSNFAWANPESGGRVVRSALARCQERGIPALFLSLPVDRLQAWLAYNPFPGTTVTGATVFGHGLPAGFAWNINTSEV